MTPSTSGLAKPVDHPQINLPKRKKLIPWGVCVHTTGRGVLDAALREKTTPEKIAESLYGRDGAYCPHYFIAHDGTIFQIADESLHASHIGLTIANRARYALNTWRSKVPTLGIELWQKAWPNRKSPLPLYPSRSPNEDYIGVELIPMQVRERNETLFTNEQYRALERLLIDVADRYAIPLLEEGSSRLLGHEDLSPLTRWDSIGGWDPGALRPRPYFRWDLLTLPRSKSPAPVVG